MREAIRGRAGDGIGIGLVFERNLKFNNAIDRAVYLQPLRKIVFRLPPRADTHQHVSQNVKQEQASQTNR